MSPAKKEPTEVIETLKTSLDTYCTAFKKDLGMQSQMIAQECGATIFFDIYIKKYKLAKKLLNELNSPGISEEVKITAVHQAHQDHQKLLKWTLYSKGQLGKMLKEAVDALPEASACREMKTP